MMDINATLRHATIGHYAARYTATLKSSLAALYGNRFRIHETWLESTECEAYPYKGGRNNSSEDTLAEVQKRVRF